MWVTDPQSPSSSAPSTPSHSAVHIPSPSSDTHAAAAAAAAAPTLSHASAPPQSPPPLGLGPSNNHPAPQPASTSQVRQLHDPAPPVPQSQGPGAFSQSLSTAVPASSLPGTRLSGRLVGVISLTDILNIYARSSGLSPADPNVFRSQRRRSSSSSMGVRRSGDIAREFRNRGGP